jgi:hypothetical protein
MYISKIKTVINKLFCHIKTFFNLLKNSTNPYLIFAPPGHFYSPLPNLLDIKKNREALFTRDRTACPGIDLHVHDQINLIKSLTKYYDQMPFLEDKQNGYRYYFNNSYYGHGSAIILYSLLRHYTPKRVIEVGSGFSSAAMLDINEHFLNNSILFSFIEPYPERLLSLLTDNDKKRHQIYTKPVQQVSNSIFSELENNDILFIDSSHVAKIGSDVVLLMTEILPILNKGVIIHIHDIYWPFEYPENWILSGRAWNEAYIIKSFLQFNSSFRILLFNSFLSIHYKSLMEENLPLFIPDSGSSLWIIKTA